MSSGRRAGQKFDAVHGVTTEALVFLGDLDPHAVGPNIEFASHYEATPVVDVERVLDAIPLQPEQTTFVDAGSGMGRVVLLAARRPYRQVIGLEISPALHEIARENLEAFPTSDRQCHDVRLVRADAASARFPRGDLAVYLYNPFRAPVLRSMLERLLARKGDAELVIAYHTPLERLEIEATASFDTVADLGFARIYRLSRRPSNSANPGTCDPRS